MKDSSTILMPLSISVMRTSATFLIMITISIWSLLAHDAPRHHRIVNSSYQIVEVDTCRNAVQLVQPVFIPSGQHVVLIQTLGYYRQPVWSVVDTTVGNWVYLLSAMDGEFDVSMSCQLTTVAHARVLTVDDTITCAEWDGIRGGIIAIDCTDTLYINNVIDASGKGFRGGTSTLQRDDFNLEAEGVQRLSARRRSSNNILHQGGGRGEGHNGGGAGGGHAGHGGRGGRECSAFNSDSTYSIPGESVAVSDSVIEVIMGGGGGAGHQNDHSDASGGSGGGIILLRAPVIVSHHGFITAAGTSGHSVKQDGAGGGGAGGLVVLDADTVDGAITVDIRGGNGGKAVGDAFCYGSGGGGSAGRLVVTHTSLLPSSSEVTVMMQGGVGGVSHEMTKANANVFVDCNSQYHGEAGDAGEVIVRTPVPTRLLYGHAHIATIESAVCPGEAARLAIGSDTLQTPTLIRSTWFRYTGQSATSCWFADSVWVPVRKVNGLHMPEDTTIARGDSITLSIGNEYTNIVWSNGARGARCVVHDTGLIFATAFDHECKLTSDTMHVVFKKKHSTEGRRAEDASHAFRGSNSVTRVFDPCLGAIFIERLNDLNLAVHADATLVGIHDLLGRRLDVRLTRNDNVNYVQLAVAPTRELYITLTSNEVTRTIIVWLQ